MGNKPYNISANVKVDGWHDAQEELDFGDVRVDISMTVCADTRKEAGEISDSIEQSVKDILSDHVDGSVQ